jgi:predicted MFS family arabinose efflux permease
LARSLLADISPLRESAQYRLFYSGEAVASFGRQLTLVAAPIQIYAMTESTLLVGLLGLAQFPTILIGSTLGGLASDAWDRRWVLMIAQSVLALIGVGLALNTTSGSGLIWVVFVLMSLQGLFFAIDAPARMSTIPRLVGTGSIPAAYALETLLSQFAKALGPIAAGFMIATWNLTLTYSIAAVTFVLAVILMGMMKPLPASGGGTKPGLRSIGEGLTFLKTKKAIQGAFLIDIAANVFGLPRALYPEMGLSVFGGTAATVGFLYAAPGIGALVAAATSGWIGRVKRAGVATTVAVVFWGGAIMVFGFSSSIQLALVALFVAGGADAISAVFRAIILQLTTPDELRGRLSGLKIAVVAGGPRLGDAEAGLVSRVLGPSVTAWTGGLASALSALAIAYFNPTFYNWQTPEQEESVIDPEPRTN